ncbi:MAG: hypothetical protein ABS35_33705 [Kaistia sp. SCN 65-12]|jgi:GNAT superfamily N-acetyltransferase|nr:MAG: hypothetical protein ABS35_33705 [Kaistia sp. SCN 65-12]
MTEKISSGRPGKFPAKRREAFIALVREGREVGEAVLARNVKEAEALVFAGRGPKGVAALKNPLASYRKRIGGKSGFEIDATAFPFELGYVFVAPQARGKGLSNELVKEAIRLAGGRGIFATARIDNTPMLAALVKAGFEVRGEPYGGRTPKRRIQILVRTGGETKAAAK